MIEDGISHRGAHRLAANIQEFWHRLGHNTVRVWVEESRLFRKHPDVWGVVYCVRSNLVGGLPPPESEPA